MSDAPAQPPNTERPAAASPEQGATLLAAGGLVVVPTETVIGVAADARSHVGIEKLRGLLEAGSGSSEAGRGPLAWHAADVQSVLAALGALPALHRRLIERLAPGPALFAVEMDETRLAGVRAGLGVAPGVIDDGAALLVRVPAHPAATALLRAARGPVVMAGVPAPRADRLRDSADAMSALATAGLDGCIAAFIDAPPPPLGAPSTLLRLTSDGNFTIARPGAYEERFIRARIARTILFVCTGNTCRSPMAEAIALHLLKNANSSNAIPTLVASAGVSAWGGEPAASEGIDALRALGIPAPPHRATPLTRELLQEADIVYAMTSGHAHAAADIDPASASKVNVLDPGGEDVPDPIGRGPAAYAATADRLVHLVSRRLGELGLIVPGIPQPSRTATTPKENA